MIFFSTVRCKTALERLETSATARVKTKDFIELSTLTGDGPEEGW
jgi:hypothetical protein